VETDVPGSWQSGDYAAAWAAEDLMAPLLEVPRRISAALLSDSGVEVRHIIDLGSGPGSYLRFMLDQFPEAHGTWVDGSSAMLELAQSELSPVAERLTFAVCELEELDPTTLEPADVVVSSRALHHLSPTSLASAYRAVAMLLTPGGFVFNLDHVGSPEDHWHGSYRRVREQFIGRRRKRLDAHRQDGPLPPADLHLESMTAAGLRYADVPWRFLMTALLAARKGDSADRSG
jgi:trans-aconitate methyltransferase